MEQKVSRTLVFISVIALLFCLYCILLLGAELLSPEQVYAAAKDEFSVRGNDEYFHLDPANIFDTSGTSNSNDGIAGGAITIIDFIITKIALPIGIVLSTWRVIYLAIFPLIIGKDPLGYVNNYSHFGSRQRGKGKSESKRDFQKASDPFQQMGQSFAGFGRGVAGTNKASRGNNYSHLFNDTNSYAEELSDKSLQENVVYCIKEECRIMFLGLLITFITWGLIELLLKVSVTFLNIADTTTSGLVS